MTRSTIISLLAVMGLCTISCWEQQSHKSTNPELPNYTVSGAVTNSLSNEPLSGAFVSISGHSTVTDSLGRYSIAHVVAAENHTITITRDGFESHSMSFPMGYGDMDSFDVVLGMLIHFSRMYQAPGPEPNGIVWTEGMAWSNCADRKRLYLVDEAKDFQNVKYFDSPGSYPPKGNYSTPYGLTVSRDSGIEYLWASVVLADGTSRAYKMSVRGDSTLTIISQFDPPQSIYGQDVNVILNDLAWDGSHVWSCSARERRIYRHSEDMAVDGAYSFSGENPAGLAWDGERFWMCSSSSNRLYRLDARTLQPMGYYVLEEAPVVGLIFRDGYLWACKHGAQSWPAYFYAYLLD